MIYSMTREEAISQIDKEIAKGGSHTTNFDAQVEKSRVLVRQYFKTKLKNPSLVPAKHMFERLSESYICRDAMSKAMILEGFTAFYESGENRQTTVRFRFNCSRRDHHKMEEAAEHHRSAK